MTRIGLTMVILGALLRLLAGPTASASRPTPDAPATLLGAVGVLGVLFGATLAALGWVWS